MNKQDEIISLKKLLDYHDNRYYVEDDPEISDAEYDSLKNNYLQLTGNEEYEYVPGKAKKDFSEVEHVIPIKSLDKVNNREDLKKEITRLWPIIIEPKFDGLTLVIYPYDDKPSIKTIATRGDGNIGENVYNTAKNIKGLGNCNVFLKTIIRGEAIIPISKFNEINAERISLGEKPFKNPRNAVAGMLRNKDASKVKGVEFYAYNIVNSSNEESVQLSTLNNLNWNITPHWKFETIDEAVDFVVNFNRESLDYEIDGIVIKSDKENSLKEFGEIGHHPKNAVAYKFPAQGKWTKLKNIIWQVGRTGKITPVAEIDPVDINGSTISRVTLHNIGIIRALKIANPCEVFVIKANDVIPAIIKSRNIDSELINEFSEPDECPTCHYKVNKVNDQIFCANIDCQSKAISRLVHLASRNALDIEGLSEETACKLYESNMISDPYDIFNLTEEQIIKLDGFAKKSAKKLYDAIQKSRDTEFKRFLYAAGIPSIGRSVSEDIANKFCNWESFVEDAENDFAITKTIEGIGNISIQYINDYGYLLGELRKYVTPRSVVKSNTLERCHILTFVITGVLDMHRNEYEKIIKEAGHKTSGSVSSKTDYVLVGRDAGSKLNKALSLGFREKGKLIEDNHYTKLQEVIINNGTKIN